ncbi:3-oxo-tetronate kinase [Thioclava indica]|uniref:3-oxo-tetronate kinase n=1 Tax=Thioclava indica TaxID=1353528 RepID=A0A074K9Y7_9RHOB|nr:3-oxo-tetronate kinase [Thioclava indica]KEO58362.1 hypothetical protein DT23_16575 [Thioclava indica]
MTGQGDQIEIGAIADDFTGACDLAVMLRRSGMRVALRVGVPEGTLRERADAVVVALKTRNIAPDLAVAESCKAARWLRDHLGAKRLFFKYCSTFDSTDAGNIGPVSDALMQEAGAKRAIAAPAFPENGRRVFMGHLFVGDRLLSESSMAQHPLTPMHDPDLVRVLSRQRSAPVGLIDKTCIDLGAKAVRAAYQDADAGTMLICDAVCDGDLDTLAQAVLDAPLVTGGSAIGAALARQIMAGRSAQRDAFTRPDQAQMRALVLSGSGSEMTRAQVSQAIAVGYEAIKVGAAEAGQPEALAKQVLDQLAACSNPRQLVYATDRPEQVQAVQKVLGREEAGARLETFFAILAQQAVARGYNAFVVAGGETSGAVVRGLGVQELAIGPEIAPGVPWAQGGGLWLALKSGNFGQADFFETAVSMLEQGEPA